MKASAIPFIVIVVAYFALELFVASSTRHRMEPEYIFANHVKASRAVDRCGPLKPVDADKFDANYRYSRRRAVAARTESEPNESEASIEAIVHAQEEAGRREVDALVDELGCDDTELFMHRKRYEILARRNLPTERTNLSR